MDDLDRRDVILWRGQAVLHEADFKRLGELFLTPKELFFISLATDAPIGGTEFGVISAFVETFLGPLRWMLGRLGGSPLKQIGQKVQDIEDAPGAMDLETRYSLIAGSFRAEYSELESIRRRWNGRVRLETDLGARYDLDAGREGEAVLALLERLRASAPEASDG